MDREVRWVVTARAAAGAAGAVSGRGGVDCRSVVARPTTPGAAGRVVRNMLGTIRRLDAIARGRIAMGRAGKLPRIIAGWTV